MGGQKNEQVHADDQQRDDRTTMRRVGVVDRNDHGASLAHTDRCSHEERGRMTPVGSAASALEHLRHQRGNG